MKYVVRQLQFITTCYFRKSLVHGLIHFEGKYIHICATNKNIVNGNDAWVWVGCSHYISHVSALYIILCVRVANLCVYEARLTCTHLTICEWERCSTMFRWEPEGRRLSPFTSYSDSALLVLNGTSLSSDIALLALNWRNVLARASWLIHFHVLMKTDNKNVL